MKHNNLYKKYTNRKENTTKKEKNIFQDGRLCKFFLILYSNTYVFDWELKKKYNFTSKEIQKYSTLLEEKQYISYNLLSDLSLIRIESILLTTPDSDKIYKENPKIYTITKTGLFEGKELITQLLKLNETHEVWYETIKRLADEGRAKKQVLKELQEVEKSEYKRPLRIPGFDNIEVETKIVKDFRKELLLNKKNVTHQKNQLLNNSSNTQLMTLENNINKSNYSKLQLSKEDENILKTQNIHISDKEVNKINKHHILDVRKKVKELYAQTAHIEKNDHLLEHTKMESTVAKYMLGEDNPQEAMDFLNSLGGEKK